MGHDNLNYQSFQMKLSNYRKHHMMSIAVIASVKKISYLKLPNWQNKTKRIDLSQKNANPIFYTAAT